MAPVHNVGIGEPLPPQSKKVVSEPACQILEGEGESKSASSSAPVPASAAGPVLRVDFAHLPASYYVAMLAVRYCSLLWSPCLTPVLAEPGAHSQVG